MSKKKDDVKLPEPMDASAPERAQGAVHVNHPRDAYGLTTLISEVLELFPETEVETDHPDGRNTNLRVAMVSDETHLLAELLEIVGKVDQRIKSVDSTTGTIYVQLHSNPRTQDLRDPFDLAEALDVIYEDDMANLDAEESQ